MTHIEASCARCLRSRTLSIPNDKVEEFKNLTYWCPPCIDKVERRQGIQYTPAVNGFMYDGPCCLCGERTTILMRLDVGPTYDRLTALCSKCEKKQKLQEEIEEAQRTFLKNTFVEQIIRDSPYRVAPPLEPVSPVHEPKRPWPWFTGLVVLFSMVTFLVLMPDEIVYWFFTGAAYGIGAYVLYYLGVGIRRFIKQGANNEDSTGIDSE